MFKKVLIANRGEIALRVIRACRDLGIPSVAVYSDADRDSLHVVLADEAYNIGPAPSKESYLNVDNILRAVKKSGADAVHPGYGFLSENADFGEALEKASITFIGPTPANIRSMGDKISAIRLMRDAGVPTVPGSGGPVDTVEEAKKIVEKIGLPVMIKATAGGGGKGMRVVHKIEELESSYRAARSEGLNYFKNDTVYIERFIQNPKHIEVQIFGDTLGNVVHLFERECSIQRRNQKIIEESPSPSVPPEVRKRLGDVSVKAAKAINYRGAGTFEFIFDNTTKDFFFMEMNTRLQVEHPVTELVTGQDLVQLQLRIARGEAIPFTQGDLSQRGHALECRVYAEDPGNNFLPATGTVLKFVAPDGPGIRVDSGIKTGDCVTIHYDPMIAKVITSGPTRAAAVNRMIGALRQTVVLGVSTNIPFLLKLLDHPAFAEGKVDTTFVDNHLTELLPQAEDVDPMALIALALSESSRHQSAAGTVRSDSDPFSPWNRADGFRLWS